MRLRYADTWNAFGQFEGTFEEGFQSNLRSKKLLDRYCMEIQRDPNTIRGSVLMIEPKAFLSQGLLSFYESEDVFREIVERYRELGMTDFMLIYPFREEQIPRFEKIAREVIPKLRGL
jgi:hypothetical protein